MADNVDITPGAGKKIGTDEVVDGTLGTVQVQYVKIMDGTLDGTTKATVNATGLKVDASGAAVPVTDNSASLTVDAPVGTPVFVTLTPNTTGGWSVSTQTALTNTKIAVKASAGTFGGYSSFWNPNTSVVYVQVFDVASASVTLGTTAPTHVIAVPPQAAGPGEITNGINHATAITLAATTTPTGSTAPASTCVATFLFK